MLTSQTNVNDITLGRHFEGTCLLGLTNVPEFNLNAHTSTVKIERAREGATDPMRSIVRCDDVSFRVLVKDFRARQNNVGTRSNERLDQLQGHNR